MGEITLVAKYSVPQPVGLVTKLQEELEFEGQAVKFQKKSVHEVWKR
jgi:hypothetical protein